MAMYFNFAPQEICHGRITRVGYLKAKVARHVMILQKASATQHQKLSGMVGKILQKSKKLLETNYSQKRLQNALK